jgi:hypothetical protein
VGDEWTYKVLFPDSKSYQLTEKVQQIFKSNGTRFYLIFRDDAHHISTQYIWITADWREIKTFKPQIGNLLVNSTDTYSPPAELFHIPFHVGDRWTVKSQVITTIESDTRSESTRLLQEERETESIEEVSTPAGRFRSFKVTVGTNGTMSESLWFDPSLGKVVYGEFYNGSEKVTETLVAFVLGNRTASGTQLLPSNVSTNWNMALGESGLGGQGKLYVQQTRHFRPQG